MGGRRETELLDGRLTGTLAWYNLTKQNIAVADPFRPGFFLVTGEVRSRGLEADVAGEILPGWHVIGAYAYTDSEITKDTEDEFGNPIGNQGRPFFGVPRHGGSLWTTFEPQAGAWRGLTLGAGVVARSQREGDFQGTYQLPGYATINLLAGHGWKVGPTKVSLQLNVDNLLDKTYFVNSDSSRTGIFFGAPRTFLESVRVEF